jgi:hypothetical protein
VYVGLIVASAGLASGLGALVYRVQSARVATLVAVASGISCALGSALLVPGIFRGSKRSTEPVAGDGAPAASGSSILVRVLCAVLFAAIEDGLVATSTTMRAHTSLLTSVGVGVEAACVLILPLALLLLPVAFVLSRPGAGVLGKHVRAGLGGQKPEGEGLAVVLYAALLAIGANLSWRLGLLTSETQAAQTAVLVSAASAVACTLMSAFIVAMVAGPFASWTGLAKLARFVPAWIPLEDVCLAALGVILLYALLPEPQAITPAAAVVGFALGPQVSSRIGSVHALSRLPALALAGGAVVVTLGAVFAFEHLPDLVRVGVVGRAPPSGRTGPQWTPGDSVHAPRPGRRSRRHPAPDA